MRKGNLTTVRLRSCCSVDTDDPSQPQFALLRLGNERCYSAGMHISIVTKPVPLRLDEGEVLRVGNTRVSLDSVVAAFHDGATPEEIVQHYDVLALADVYAVIAYYLEHQQEIDAYLTARRSHREQVRQEIEAHHSPSGIRQRLLARRQPA